MSLVGIVYNTFNINEVKLVFLTCKYSRNPYLVACHVTTIYCCVCVITLPERASVVRGAGFKPVAD